MRITWSEEEEDIDDKEDDILRSDMICAASSCLLSEILQHIGFYGPRFTEGVPLNPVTGLTALHYVAYGPDTPTSVPSIKFLIERGDIDKQDVYGNTPLHWACFMGKFHQARTLIECGAETCVENNDGYVPQRLTCKKAIIELFE